MEKHTPNLELDHDSAKNEKVNDAQLQEAETSLNHTVLAVTTAIRALPEGQKILDANTEAKGNFKQNLIIALTMGNQSVELPRHNMLHEALAKIPQNLRQELESAVLKTHRLKVQKSLQDGNLHVDPMSATVMKALGEKVDTQRQKQDIASVTAQSLAGMKAGLKLGSVVGAAKIVPSPSKKLQDTQKRTIVDDFNNIKKVVQESTKPIKDYLQPLVDVQDKTIKALQEGTQKAVEKIGKALESTVDYSEIQVQWTFLRETVADVIKDVQKTAEGQKILAKAATLSKGNFVDCLTNALVYGDYTSDFIPKEHQEVYRELKSVLEKSISSQKMFDLYATMTTLHGSINKRYAQLNMEPDPLSEQVLKTLKPKLSSLSEKVEREKIRNLQYPQT